MVIGGFDIYDLLRHRVKLGVILTFQISCYDLRDGKMIYLLTQHALFNCKHHPFLLCKCRRGEGICNPNHQ